MDVDFCLELELALVKAYGWSLYEIDRTSIESLLPFVMHAPRSADEATDVATTKANGKKQLFCDQVSWL